MTEPVTAADVVENLEAPGWMSSEAAYGYGCGVSGALRALREACGGGDIVIRKDGTLATLSLNYREVGTYVTIDSYVVVPLERGA